MSFTLHDLPNVIEQAKVHWSINLPEAIEGKRVQFIGMDFFKDAPAAGQDIYFIRHVVHNYPDSEALIILRKAREVMHPQSRLFIHEYVLQPAVRTEDPLLTELGVDMAPEPLHPNFGAGNFRSYAMDITMLVQFNAQERSLRHFDKLGAAVGLKLIKLWECGEKSMLEFHVRDVEARSVDPE